MTCEVLPLLVKQTRKAQVRSRAHEQKNLPEYCSSPGSLSTGFGFIEFNSHVGAVDGMRKLDGSIVDGHQIQCKISVGQASDAARSASARRTKRNTADGGASGVRSTLCTKLVVRNVAFEVIVGIRYHSFG